jgi:hypothetical protein
MTVEQQERINITLNRAIEQSKINNKSDASITENKDGLILLNWKNSRRSFCFTIFQEGSICSGKIGMWQE